MAGRAGVGQRRLVRAHNAGADPGARRTGSAALSTVPASTADKPIAMWLVQALSMAAAGLSLVYGWKWTAIAADSFPRGSGNAKWFVFGIFFVLFVWMLAIAITAYRRMPAVRWLGGAFIACIVLLSIFGAYFENMGDPSDVGFQRMRTIIGTVVVAIECYWLYAFAFAGKARRYLGLP